MMLAAAILLAALQLQAPAIPVTADQLRANPERFEGKRIVLRGQMDLCFRFSCSICPLDATRASIGRGDCLSLSFDRARARREDIGATFDPLYRYADVVLTATFDPSCWPGQGDPCSDRASVLLNARVEEVTKRRTSHEGLIFNPEPLVDAPSEIARPIIADLLRRTLHDAPSRRVSAFLTPSPLSSEEAFVCRSDTESDDERGAWPDSFQALVAPSTEDRYRCWGANKVGGEWLVNPE